MQHFEQAFLAACALSFAGFCHRQKIQLPFSFWFCCAFLSGILLGKIVLIFIFEFFGMTASTRFSVLSFATLQDFFFNFQWALWSGLGIGWIIVLHIFKLKKIAPAFLMALLPLVFLPVLAMDYTRVVAIAAFPLLLQYIFFNAAFLEKIKEKTLILLFLLWVLMPCVWFYVIPRGSFFSWNIAYLIFKLLGIEVVSWEYLSKNFIL